jgi:AraC-like DNA-binding protein
MQTQMPGQFRNMALVEIKTSWEELARSAQYRPSILAERCGVSMRTLQRYFRTHYDKTVSDWLRELRLNEAFSSLKQCDSVKEVAFDLGYKQPSHFTRDFKKKFGVPPRVLMVHPRAHRLPAP